jgi:hypothetical protein
MVAHTGFIIVARRVPEETAIGPALQEPTLSPLPTDADQSSAAQEEPDN